MRRGLRRVALGAVVSMASVLPAAVLGSANPASAATPWSIVGIGLTPGGMNSFGTSINAGGDVAATLTTSTAVRDGGLYKGGTLTDLGGLEGQNASEADSINASDTEVGRSGPSAVEYSGGTVSDLLTPGGFGEAGATGISDANTIVGWVNPASADTPEYAAQFVGGGGTVHLGALPGNGVSIAFGVSNDGTIVGSAVDSSGQEQAVTFAGGAATLLSTLPGARSSEAHGVSNTGGHIVGFAYDSTGVQHALQFSATGPAVDLGGLSGASGTTAVGVNSADQAVGYSTFPDSDSSTAELFANGTVTDLNTLLPASSGWSLQLAGGINDAGQITGTGSFNGHYEGFVLTPPPPPRPACAPPTGPVSGVLNGLPVLGPLLAALICRIGLFLNVNL
jgi:uncharacterized membrane protein